MSLHIIKFAESERPFCSHYIVAASSGLHEDLRHQGSCRRVRVIHALRIAEQKWKPQSKQHDQRQLRIQFDSSVSFTQGTEKGKRVSIQQEMRIHFYFVLTAVVFPLGKTDIGCARGPTASCLKVEKAEMKATRRIPLLKNNVMQVGGKESTRRVATSCSARLVPLLRFSGSLRSHPCRFSSPLIDSCPTIVSSFWSDALHLPSKCTCESANMCVFKS